MPTLKKIKAKLAMPKVCNDIISDDRKYLIPVRKKEKITSINKVLDEQLSIMDQIKTYKPMAFALLENV